ncbi:phage holin family protein [Pedobacter glucosidilyticus]|uniref:phage holin family protein n=1 Tax=Pedobacter glucosidilyticus TaxID=1122941 RepID=UPI00047930E4|nr:phage holin family protein [Pedobacter glucosidilyticus]
MEELIEKIKEHLHTRMKLAKLTLVEKGVLLFANLITDGLVIIFLVLAFLFVSLAFGFYISELLGNSYGGFFLVSLFYFLIAVIVYAIKDKYLEKPIVNNMIRKIFKKQEEE